MKSEAGTGLGLIAACGAMLASAGVGGCEAPFGRIDRRTTELLAETNEQLGDETDVPRLDWEPGSKPDKYRGDEITQYDPPTENPSSRQLTFTPSGDADNVLVVELPHCHGDGGHVVYADGRVEFIEPYDKIERLVERTLANLGRTE